MSIKLNVLCIVAIVYMCLLRVNRMGSRKQWMYKPAAFLVFVSLRTEYCLNFRIFIANYR